MERFVDLTEHPERVFVIGDLHGCLAELETLISFLKKKRSLKASDGLIFIGDYIDRGPDSSGVIDYLLALKKKFPETIFLRGNHEDMLLDFLGYEGSMGHVWIANGGSKTLESYGIPPVEDPENVIKVFPKEHLAFLLNLERYVVAGDFVCVHAGLNPLRELQTQIDEDIYWIREDFISEKHNFEKTIVFGHTPFHEILFNTPYKIGIDTGAVYKNKLSCIELFGKETFQVKSGEGQVVTGKW